MLLLKNYDQDVIYIHMTYFLWYSFAAWNIYVLIKNMLQSSTNGVVWTDAVGIFAYYSHQWDNTINHSMKLQ